MKWLIINWRLVVNAPFAWPYVIIYLCSKRRCIINEDIDAFGKVHGYTCSNQSSYTKAFYKEFISYREFRSLFYHRLGKISGLIRWLFRPQRNLSLDCPNIGGGMYIQHGYCTDIVARSIGKNCWINQKVTLGWKGAGCPTIGDNVRIGVGALIIGDVHIGNNVKIGAGAIVVKDVPNDCLVTCEPAKIKMFYK